MTMAETAGPLPSIVELAKVDVLIARLAVQKRNLQAELVKRAEGIKAVEAKRASKKKLFDEKRIRYEREEKSIRAEREKLSDRRRALVSLSSYKAQQAGEREVEYASKQLSAHEDAILNLLKDAEILEKDYNELASTVEGLTNEFTVFEPDSKKTLEEIDTKLAELVGERDGFVKAVNHPPSLSIYTRVKERYPMDPVVSVHKNEQCSGCHMKTGPQVIVQVSRGELVRCPGCARILTLEAKAAE